MAEDRDEAEARAEAAAELGTRGLGRDTALLLVTLAICVPGPVLRLLDLTNAYNYSIPNWVEAIIFGVGIFAAATLLTWASEVAETEISAGLALVVLALIAVLPEYAVDLYFAITAPTNPEHAHLAIANMTGGNRLLVGLAWPVIFLIFWRKTKLNIMPIDRGNALGIAFLGAATLYSFTIPLRGHLSLIDTAIMFSMFGGYMYITSKSPPEEDREFIGPAAVIGSLPRLPRRLAVVAIFVFCAGVIFAAAEPFATSLVDTGKEAGIDEFILVQWVAPIASESPEFILAGLLALRGRHDAGMTILISSKVNQWTLLVGSLPLGFAISDGSLHTLSFDSRQSEEVFLTAAQSLFAVAILVSLSMHKWEAGLLAALFATQFFFTDTSVRIAYSIVYCGLAAIIFISDLPHMGDFRRAVKEGLTPGPDHPPPQATGPP
jgi:cation:H+ antiporter